MPQLKNLSCSIQWADTGAPFQEYGTVYGDGLVESLIVVPNKPQLFTIRLKSVNFIHEGLSVIVFIDGNYQTNRNRVNLQSRKRGLPANRVGVDFLLRQREKPIGEGIYMGRDWRFDNHNIVESLPEGVKESHFDLLGTIEVLVLRCRSRAPQDKDESGSESAADSDVLDERGTRPVTNGNEDDNGPANLDGAAEPKHAVHPTKVTEILHRTQKQRYQYGLDGDNGQYIWPPWSDPRFAQRRNPSQQHSIAQPLPNLTSYHTLPLRSRTPQTPQRTSSQKRVRFDLGPQPVTPPQMPAPPRPPSYERTRPTNLPPLQHNHTNNDFYGPPNHQHMFSQGHSTSHPSQHIAGPSIIPPHHTGYQQQHVLHTNHNHPPPPIPDHPPIYNPHPSVPQYPHPGSTSPYNVSFPHVPHPNPVWYTQPPHLVFNPYQSYHNLGWPLWPNAESMQAPDSGNNTATAVDASKDSNDGENKQGTNGAGNNDPNMSWDQWDKAKGNTPITAASNQTSENDTAWVNGEGSNDTQQTNNFDTQSTINNNDTANNDFQDSNQDGNGFQEFDNNNDSGNTGNGGWSPNDTNAQSNGNNATTDNVQFGLATSRALFGPHGQYFTYKPRGPDDPKPDAEEEPRYDVPRSIAEGRGSSKQVLPGSGYMYFKKQRAPEYLDTMEEPYARFIFKYRTKEQLEKEIGIKIEVEPTGDQEIQELQNLEKQALIDMLIRAKSALGGKVPSPPPKPANLVKDSTAPIPVDPPDHLFLRYKLPESRPTNTTTTSATSDSDGVKAGGTGTGGSAPDTWATENNANNPNGWEANPSGSRSNNKNFEWNEGVQTSHAPNNNWCRVFDGIGEQEVENFNDDLNEQCNGVNSEGQQHNTSPPPPIPPPPPPFSTPSQQMTTETFNPSQMSSSSSWAQNPTPWPSQACGPNNGWSVPNTKSASWTPGPPTA